MQRLLQEDELRATLASNGYKKVQKHYDWTEIARRFESLYRHVQTGRKSYSAAR